MIKKKIGAGVPTGESVGADSNIIPRRRQRCRDQAERWCVATPEAGAGAAVALAGALSPSIFSSLV